MFTSSYSSGALKSSYRKNETKRVPINKLNLLKVSKMVEQDFNT